MPAAADGSGGIACIQNQIGVIVLRKRIWCSFLSLLVIINLLPLFDLSGIAAGTLGKEIDGEVCGQHQEQRTANHHHAAYGLNALGQP